MNLGESIPSAPLAPIEQRWKRVLSSLLPRPWGPDTPMRVLRQDAAPPPNPCPSWAILMGIEASRAQKRQQSLQGLSPSFGIKRGRRTPCKKSPPALWQLRSLQVDSCELLEDRSWLLLLITTVSAATTASNIYRGFIMHKALCQLDLEYFCHNSPVALPETEA